MLQYFVIIKILPGVNTSISPNFGQEKRLHYFGVPLGLIQKLEATTSDYWILCDTTGSKILPEILIPYRCPDFILDSRVYSQTRASMIPEVHLHPSPKKSSPGAKPKPLKSKIPRNIPATRPP